MQPNQIEWTTNENICIYIPFLFCAYFKLINLQLQKIHFISLNLRYCPERFLCRMLLPLEKLRCGAIPIQLSIRHYIEFGFVSN